VRAAVVSVLLSAAVLTPAASAAEARVRGPASVTPGRIVTFHATGFRPGNMVSVVLTPAGKPACCAARIAASFPVSPSGGATLIFRMPRVYKNCADIWHCRKVQWRPNERVIVGVFGYLQEASTITSVGP
jgi:hypothetical protein